MPNDQENAVAPVHVDESAMKVCPGCGCLFPAGGRGMGKQFHSDACRQAFHAVHRKQGFPIIALAKAHAATRHAKPGTREAKICTFARGQLTQILSEFLSEDEDEGRDVVAYVGTLMDSGFVYADRAR